MSLQWRERDRITASYSVSVSDEKGVTQEKSLEAALQEKINVTRSLFTGWCQLISAEAFSCVVDSFFLLLEDALAGEKREADNVGNRQFERTRRVVAINDTSSEQVH